MTWRAPDQDQPFRDQLVELLPRMRRFALSLTGDMTEADDLVQAACERALARRHQWRSGSRLDSWIFSIIHHLLIDEHRSMRKQRQHLPLTEERLPSTTANNMRKLEARWRLGQVKAAMQQLSDRERVIISLVCIDGMSYQDAASTLQIPLGTVMSRLARARKRLHQLVTARQTPAAEHNGC